MRHAMILQLIDTMEIDTQEVLAEQLMRRGVRVTQATISREIKELRLIKTLGEDGKYHIYDYWNEKYLGVYNGSIDIKDLAPRGCKLLWLTPVKEDVTLVGATTHIAGIGIRLEKSSDGTITLYAPHFSKTEQKVTLVVPDGVKLTSSLTYRVLCDNRHSGIVTVSFVANEDEPVVLERE